MNINNKVSDSVNDRLTKSYNQIKSIYESTVDLTSNAFVFDTSNNNLTVNKSKFIINTDLNEIRLGNSDIPDSMILYGTSNTSGLDSSTPNGSLYLTQYNNGEAYIKNNSEWIKIKNPENYDNLVVNNNLTINDNLSASSNLNISGSINITPISSEHTYFNSSLTVSGYVSTNNFDISNTSISSNLINTENIYCNNLNISDTLTLNNNIICSSDIISYNNISGNNININSNGIIDLSGNLNSYGSVNVSGNISSTINNLTLSSQSSGFTISGGTSSKTLTVNNTLDFSGTDSTTMTFPSTSQDIVGLTSSQNLTNKTLTLSSGTTSITPLQFTSGTNLTTPENGSIEFNNNNYFATSLDSNNNNIRKYLPNLNYYRIDSDTTSMAGSDVSVFLNGVFTMDANAYYIIDYHLFILKETSNGIHTYSIVTSQNPVYVNVQSMSSVNGDNTMAFGTTTTTTLPLSELVVVGNNYHVIKAYILNGATSGTVKLNVTISAGSMKLKRGSHIIIKKIPNENFGSFS